MRIAVPKETAPLERRVGLVPDGVVRLVKAGHAIAHNLKDTLRGEIPQLGHVLIHIEPDDIAGSFPPQAAVREGNGEGGG